MFDGNTFFPVTGTPIRKMACMRRPLAEADPVPLAVAILKAKSLMRSMDPLNHEVHGFIQQPSPAQPRPRAGSAPQTSSYPTRRLDTVLRTVRSADRCSRPSP